MSWRQDDVVPLARLLECLVHLLQTEYGFVSNVRGLQTSQYPLKKLKTRRDNSTIPFVCPTLDSLQTLLLDEKEHCDPKLEQSYRTWKDYE